LFIGHGNLAARTFLSNARDSDCRPTVDLNAADLAQRCRCDLAVVSSWRSAGRCLITAVLSVQRLFEGLALRYANARAPARTDSTIEANLTMNVRAVFALLERAVQAAFLEVLEGMGRWIECGLLLRRSMSRGPDDKTGKPLKIVGTRCETMRLKRGT